LRFAFFGILVASRIYHGRHVVHRNVRSVLRVAIVLINDAGLHGVGSVVIKGAIGGSTRATTHIGRARQRAVVAGVGVVEACTGVGCGWIVLGAESNC